MKSLVLTLMIRLSAIALPLIFFSGCVSFFDSFYINGKPPADSGQSSIHEAQLANRSKCSDVFVNISATEKCLTSFDLQKRIYSKTGKSLATYNKMGFDSVSFSGNWVTDAFFKFCKEKSGQVTFLDVGAGYGAITQQALELSENISVTTNDLSKNHLLYIFQQTKESQRRRLFLNSQKFPNLNAERRSFDAIVMHRMLHFLSGEELDRSFSKIKEWIKPKGRVFIVTISPYHIAYRKTFLPEYLKRSKEGVRWPGMYLDVKKHLPSQAYNIVGIDLHPLGPTELERVLKENGFKIIASDFISMKRFGQEENRDGKEAVGVIAEKL